MILYAKPCKKTYRVGFYHNSYTYDTFDSDAVH
jgi:hypothetical protein